MSGPGNPARSERPIEVVSRQPYGAAARAYDLFYRDKDYEGEVEELVGIIDERRPGARSVLDVGCGTGAHLEWLARHYERAEGIEPSAPMLEQATITRPGLLVYPGDMRTFRLAARYDAVTCLFSAIGYMTTLGDLHLAVANMAHHLEDGGVLVVEGWIEPDDWVVGRASANAAVGDDLAAARVILSDREEDVSIIEMHYVLATLDAVEYVDEVHRMGLFTREQYRGAFEAAGLRYERADGLTGRGLHIGIT